MKVGGRFQAAFGKLSNLRQSVFRRGIGLMILTLPAALLNLGLAYLASKWLGAADFGIYYAAITAINIAFAPATILNLFFTRAVAAIGAEYGSAGAVRASGQVFRFIASWVGVLTGVAILLAAASWWLSGSFALWVAVLALLVIYFSYCSEAGRIAFQGDGKFVHLGVFTLLWMALRFAGGVAGIYFFRSVWAGLAGIAIAIFLPITLLFRPWTMLRERFFFPWSTGNAADQKFVSMVKFTSFAKLAAGFLLFMLVANADILAAYLTLDPVNLTIYSASSVLPKGLLIATLPLIQLIFPLIVGERASARPTVLLVVRGALLTLLVAGAGAIVIALLSEPLCTGAHGIASCNDDVMAYGLAAIVAMSLLRLAVSADYAAKNDFIPLLLTAPIAAGWLLISTSDISAPLPLGQYYAAFSVATLVSYSAASIAFRAAKLLRARMASAHHHAPR